MKEHDVQKQIVDALILAGFRVKHTTAYRQKSSSGVAKGVPDLLVGHPLAPYIFLGLEVKRPSKSIRYSSPEQKESHENKEFIIVTESVSALKSAIRFLECHAPNSEMKKAAWAKAYRTVEAIERSPGGRA